MWSTWATRLAKIANAAKIARTKMPTFATQSVRVASTTAKILQKPITQATTNAQKSWVQSLRDSISNAWNSLKKSFKMPEWLRGPTVQARVKKAFTNTAKSLGIRAPMLSSTLAAATVKAHMQEEAKPMPAFTQENIFKYRLDATLRKAFIAHAIENIATQDKEAIETIAYILERYPESHEPIANAALKKFNEANSLTLKHVLAYNAWAKDEFVKILLSTDIEHPWVSNEYAHKFMSTNKHLLNLLVNYRGQPRNKNRYRWDIMHSNGEIGEDFTHYLLRTLIEKPNLSTIPIFNTIHKWLEKLNLSNEQQKLRDAAIHYYGQDAITMIQFSTTQSIGNITAKPLCVYFKSSMTPYAVSSYETFQATLRDIKTLSTQELETAYEYNAHKADLHESLRKYYNIPSSYANSDSLNASDAIYVHYNLNKSYIIGSDEYSSISSRACTSAYPYFLYSPPTNDVIIQKTIEGISKLPASDIEYVYDKLALSDNHKNRLREAITQNNLDVPLTKTNILDTALDVYDTLPTFMLECTTQNHTSSHSEKHFCAQTTSVIKNVFRHLAIKKRLNATRLFKQALTKEREELAKGNHVFYHGRGWEWDFIADLYKEMHNLKTPAMKVGNDYTFLTFDDSKRAYGKALFLNMSLFGNSYITKNSTAHLILKNADWSRGRYKEFTTQKLAAQFKLDKYYPIYQEEFTKLELLHQQANPTKIGSLLMVVVDDKNVNTIYPVIELANFKQVAALSTGEVTLETRKIIAELKAGKLPEGGDFLEYALPLDKDYALDPQKGPRIYALNASDPVKYKEYTDYRNQLFAKIKADIDKDGVTRS